MTPAITPSTCSKRPSLAAAAAWSISAASRSHVRCGVIALEVGEYVSGTGGSATGAVRVARAAGVRAALRSADGEGRRLEAESPEERQGEQERQVEASGAR